MPTPHATAEHARVVEIQVSWGDDATLLVDHRALGRSFVVGAFAGADFELASVSPGGTGDARWQLVSGSEDAARITVPEGAWFRIEVASEQPALEGLCDRTFDRALADGESVAIDLGGLRYRVRLTDAAELPRTKPRIGAGPALTVLALGLVVCIAAATRVPERLRIVAETTIDLSNPAVAALVARRRVEPRTPSVEPRVIRFATPETRAPAASPAAPTSEAPESPVAPVNPQTDGTTAPGVAAPESPDATPTIELPDARTRRDPGRPSAASPGDTPRPNAATAAAATEPVATVDFEADVVAADDPPRELGAIRSDVRALSRCFDERVAAERDRTPAARAALDACLARARAVRPDAIVSYGIEVRDSQGNVERANGGRFGLAVPR